METVKKGIWYLKQVKVIKRQTEEDADEFSFYFKLDVNEGVLKLKQRKVRWQKVGVEREKWKGRGCYEKFNWKDKIFKIYWNEKVSMLS